MGQPKPFDNLPPDELEELIKAASQPAPPNAKKEDLSSVERWIIANDIKVGDLQVTPLMAYVAYHRWAKYPFTQRAFYKILKKKFNRKRGVKVEGQERGYVVYMFNPEPFLTIPRSTDELRAELPEINRRPEDEEKQPKKYRKVSRS